MKKFSLDWLLEIRKGELNSIELELMNVNNTIFENESLRDKNHEQINNHQTNLFNCSETWRVPSIIRSIENCEQTIFDINEKLKYLNKEKEMIFNRYTQKSVEVKMLEKSKEKFITKEKTRQNKKLEAEINELSLITRKDK